MIIAILHCWIIHRGTEVRNAFGTVLSAGIFAAISLSRAWKLMYLSRLVLFIIHFNRKKNLINLFYLFYIFIIIISLFYYSF